MEYEIAGQIYLCLSLLDMHSVVNNNRGIFRLFWHDTDCKQAGSNNSLYILLSAIKIIKVFKDFTQVYIINSNI